jgi:transcriptional regulator with XRE-family HTH domain
MPRPVRQRSPIRELRAIIGKTQRGFAFSIGISPSALKRIENNDLGLSQRVARKIEIEAGADRQSLLKGRLRTIEGTEYIAGFYEYWKNIHAFEGEEIASILASNLEILLRAAVVASASKKRMWQVYAEIAETLDRCRVDFNLQRPINAILAKQKRSPFIPDRPLKWEDILKPQPKWEATAPRKPRSSSRRRRKA